jgi:ferritin
MVMLNLVLKNALLKQATHELGSFMLYKEAALWFEIKHLDGIAKKFHSEADEEKSHFDGILKYVALRGDSVKVESPTLPERDWKNEKTIFEFFLNVEKDNYNRFHALHKQARELEDYSLEHFLIGYLDHQVKSVDEWEKRFTMVSSFTAIPGLIWHFDQIIS